MTWSLTLYNSNFSASYFIKHFWWITFQITTEVRQQSMALFSFVSDAMSWWNLSPRSTLTSPTFSGEMDRWEWKRVSLKTNCIRDFGSIWSGFPPCILTDTLGVFPEALWIHLRILVQIHSLSPWNPHYLKADVSKDLKYVFFNHGITCFMKDYLEILEAWFRFLQCFSKLLH